MGMSALAAEYPADAETDNGVPRFDRTFIVPMDGKAAGMTAGTDQLVELQGMNHIIVNFLRNRIAKIDR